MLKQKDEQEKTRREKAIGRAEGLKSVGGEPQQRASDEYRNAAA